MDELKGRFKKFMDTNEPNHVPADLFPIVFQTVARHGGEAEWEFMVSILKDPKQAALKTAAMFVFSIVYSIVCLMNTYRRGVANAGDPKLVERALHLIPDVVGGMDILWYLQFFTRNQANRRAVVNFIYQNFDMVRSRMWCE